MADYGVYKQDSVKEARVSGDNLGRVLPRQLSTGSTRGTQTVGYGDTKIDGSNNRITVGNSIVLDGDNNQIIVTSDGNSSLGMGSIPGTSEFGFFSLDASGNLIMKIINGTLYVYDPISGKNTVQVGKLPDSTYGAAGANSGFNVADGFS